MTRDRDIELEVLNMTRVMELKGCDYGFARVYVIAMIKVMEIKVHFTFCVFIGSYETKAQFGIAQQVKPKIKS